jgi:hypothetical protein
MTRVRLNPSTQAAVNKALPKGISGTEAKALVKQITTSKASAGDKVKQLKALREQNETSFSADAKRTVDRAIFEAVNDQNASKGGWKPKPSSGGGASYGGGGSR